MKNWHGFCRVFPIRIVKELAGKKMYLMKKQGNIDKNGQKLGDSQQQKRNNSRGSPVFGQGKSICQLTTSTVLLIII